MNSKTDRKFPAHRKLTQAELMAEATERFGDDWLAWAFQCPICGDVASFADFKAAGAKAAVCGQECIGRTLGALSKGNGEYTGRGCDWAAYGLFHGPWEVVLPADDKNPERSVWSFALAPATASEGASA